jgi:hypothetical protein
MTTVIVAQAEQAGRPGLDRDQTHSTPDSQALEPGLDCVPSTPKARSRPALGGASAMNRVAFLIIISISATCAAVACGSGATPPPFRLPTLAPISTLPPLALAPAQPSPTLACNSNPNWNEHSPIGQTLLRERAAYDAQGRVVAAEGVFRVDDYIGYANDRATADRLAYGEVRVLHGANAIRWFVLENEASGRSFVYLARAIYPGVPLSAILRDPLTPCHVPPHEGLIVGYHALTYDGLGPGWIRYDWSIDAGETVTDGNSVRGA